MTRDELLERICPNDASYDCSTGESGSCSKCDELLNKWLNEYDAEIRADVIDEINNREKNIPYSDFARGFKNGYEKGQMIIAEHDAKIINKFAEELKSRLGDAIYPKDFESMKNLIDDLARQTKEQQYGKEE